VDEIPDTVTILGPKGQHVYTNASGRRLLGADLSLFGGEVQLIHPDDVEGLTYEIRRLVAEPGSHRTFEFRVKDAQGSWRHLQTYGTNAADRASGRCVILHSHDVTDDRASMGRLVFERLHDRLTGFPTRGVFVEHLQRALLRAERGDTTLAVFGVDIDGLSVVNERWGYERGDELLLRVGRDLDAVLREDDAVARADAVVARFEDSFFVLYEDLLGLTSAAAIGDRLATAVRDGEPPERGDTVTATATVGVVLSAGGASNAESLLVDATNAMHVGKRRGGDRVEFFDEAVRRDAERRLEELDDLRVAIAEEQLRLVYQPKYDIASGELRGVEALVRWHHPVRGVVSPLEFIPLAEETGLIGSLGEWVLTAACRQRTEWSPLVEEAASLVMSVNVSRRQFDPAFPDIVERILADTQVPPSSLCLEVTETAVMSGVDAAIATLARLRSLGTLISIDDFGTGYSSLAQLKRLPLDELKIDRSFIDRLGLDREDTAIVSAIVTLGLALDLSVIAEGVETVDQLEHLRALGCELAQGFLLSRPVGAEQIFGLLLRPPEVARRPAAGRAGSRRDVAPDHR